MAHPIWAISIEKYSILGINHSNNEGRKSTTNMIIPSSSISKLFLLQ